MSKVNATVNVCMLAFLKMFNIALTLSVTNLSIAVLLRSLDRHAAGFPLVKLGLVRLGFTTSIMSKKWFAFEKSKFQNKPLIPK